MTEITQEDWKNWYNHKSNKEIWIEEQERQDEIQENTDTLEEKLFDITNKDLDEKLNAEYQEEIKESLLI